ncbi:MAG TPA: metallophosphoesterase family protein, partial [Negativicutes bacterium]|nr:metallophosphoesterase family protein [Negativicutes bacterium]
MKFAIVSDTHDNIKNFNKIIAWLNQQNIATILHCGDICNQEIINEAEKNFKGEIVYVRGNGDYGLRDLPDTEELDFVHKKVAMVHYPDLARKLAESGKYDLVFY